jgi:hypothetical protein
MRPALPAALLALVVTLGALPLHAASTVTAEAPPVGPFQRVEVSGHAEVVLVQGEREAVTVEGSPRNPARVRVRSEDGRLSIDVEPERGWFTFGQHRPPTITIHFRTLERLSLSGAVKVQAAAIDTPSLRVDASGATTVRIDELKTASLSFSGSGAVTGELAGTATSQRISISGAGTFRAPKLASDEVTVKVSGAGKVVVQAQKKLEASISGAGAIDYYGDPQVTQRVSGAGRITRRSADAAPARMRA